MTDSSLDEDNHSRSVQIFFRSNLNRGLKKQYKTESYSPQIYIQLTSIMISKYTRKLSVLIKSSLRKLLHQNIWLSSRTTTSLFSLPLELRNQIYDYTLSDGHDIVHDGISALYKTHPAITRELYSYRDFPIRIPITQESTYNPRPDRPQSLLHTRLLGLVERFKAKNKQHRKLILVFEAEVEGLETVINKPERFIAVFSELFASIDTTFTDFLERTEDDRRTVVGNAFSQVVWGDHWVKVNAELWMIAMCKVGVDARVTVRAVGPSRDVRTVFQQLVRSPAPC